MPKDVVGLLACWQGRFGRHRNKAIGKAIPHCLMWCIWHERYAQVFEGCEQTILEGKLQFFRTLMEWIMATGAYPFYNVLEFMGHCNLRT